MEWRVVPEWPAYEVSENGDLRMVKNGKIKAKIYVPSGYVKYRVSKTRRYRLAHRLVASAFIPNPENKPQINHIDGDKRNNCVSNLEWCTGEENWAHALATGLWNKASQFKLSESDAREIKALRGKETQTALAKRFGVSTSTVRSVRIGTSWKHLQEPELVD
jgi:hypothetical protein